MSGEPISNEQCFDVSMAPAQGDSECFDDDGRHRRTGTVWTASAHIITAVIGSAVLSFPWAIAQLGWIAGPTVVLLFSFVTCYTSFLLASCCRSGDPVAGKRNYTYMEAVQSNLGASTISLGGYKVKLCGVIQYMNLFGVAIGYTITASISMLAVKKTNYFHDNHAKNPYNISSTPYMLVFGGMGILFSQIPNFNQISWLSVVGTVMSLTYSSIGLVLGIVKIAETGKFRGSLVGISIGVSDTEKAWRALQALGEIAFAYSYSLTLIEIQNSIKSPPSESQTMKKAALLGVSVTTVFYMLFGCFGYAAFGNLTPRNLLAGFGFYNPFWVVDIANLAIVVHLVGAFQVTCQPIFAFVEKHAARKFPRSDFINKEYNITALPAGFKLYKLNLFRLLWRTVFVVITTVIAMLMPSSDKVSGILAAFGFWPLSVYFPVEMYIAQKKIPKWSSKWIGLQILSLTCLILSIAAAAGAIAGLVMNLKDYNL